MMGFLIGLTEAGYQTDVKSENFTSINDFGIIELLLLGVLVYFPLQACERKFRTVIRGFRTWLTCSWINLASRRCLYRRAADE